MIAYSARERNQTCYMEDPVVVDLAITSILYNTQSIHHWIQNKSENKDSMIDFYLNRWKGFNTKQLDCLNLFFNYIKETGNSPDTKELAEKAIDVTSYLKNKKDELYKE